MVGFFTSNSSANVDLQESFDVRFGWGGGDDFAHPVNQDIAQDDNSTNAQNESFLMPDVQIYHTSLIPFFPHFVTTHCLPRVATVRSQTEQTREL